MQTEDFFTPIAPDEEAFLAINFDKYLAVGDSIQSILSWTCTVAPKSLMPDPDPASHLNGMPGLDPDSPTVVVQSTGPGFLAGATYVMEAVVESVAGEHLSLWQYLDCVPVGVGASS